MTRSTFIPIGLLTASALLGSLFPASAVTIYGTAYNGTTGPATLYTVDPGTGATIPVGPTTFNRVSAIDFNPLTGLLYGVGTDTQGNVDLITINTTTGMGTAVGSL